MTGCETQNWINETMRDCPTLLKPQVFDQSQPVRFSHDLMLFQTPSFHLRSPLSVHGMASSFHLCSVSEMLLQLREQHFRFQIHLLLLFQCVKALMFVSSCSHSCCLFTSEHLILWSHLFAIMAQIYMSVWMYTCGCVLAADFLFLFVYFNFHHHQVTHN